MMRGLGSLYHYYQWLGKQRGPFQKIVLMCPHAVNFGELEVTGSTKSTV